jgi:hypothetical protein
MKKLFSFAVLIAANVVAFADAPMMMDEARELIINNRILATVNGRTISVMDVMKKMDVYLARFYPQFADSKAARHQFYSTNWRNSLDQMINTELMLADAEQREITVTDAEVRETLQDRFGPNVMGNLEKIGISYEEAREMIHSEMVVQRMTWFRVNSKALNTVNPKDIKAAYQEYCRKNPPVEEWKYQVVSIRTKNSGEGAKLAEKAHELLQQSKIGLTHLAKALGQDTPAQKENPITVSETLTVEDKNLSESHKSVLATLAVGAYSAPIAQVSRTDKSTVYRIFHLQEHTKKKGPSFGSVCPKLTDDLLDQAVDREQAIYITKLRERFGFEHSNMQALLPPDFQPFTLK